MKAFQAVMFDSSYLRRNPENHGNEIIRSQLFSQAMGEVQEVWNNVRGIQVTATLCQMMDMVFPGPKTEWNRKIANLLQIQDSC